MSFVVLPGFKIIFTPLKTSLPPTWTDVYFLHYVEFPVLLYLFFFHDYFSPAAQRCRDGSGKQQTRGWTVRSRRGDGGQVARRRQMGNSLCRWVGLGTPAAFNTHSHTYTHMHTHIEIPYSLGNSLNIYSSCYVEALSVKEIVNQWVIW